ncbi:MAG TPA: DNA polymerase III subunit gamma/tau [Candidatus Moranbacteria bacterium]|nr:DNA polymerase III subunit gamma/tau [Candidatus Moranbacteria bacterium]
MTLYNTYRPRDFSQVLGQKHIVRTLRNAIVGGRTGHGYLFAGPRGTGKTTLARIFAHDLNCLPRDDFSPAPAEVCDAISAGNCLDVVEIDAASHTGVDNIRQLRETVYLPPSQARYKVFIIDEAHMLSIGAWNALLKILEEPPEKTIFIFATTEIKKVPETILSRLQCFHFGRLSVPEIIEKLNLIAAGEKISLDSEAAAMIALAADGAMRDAESLLAQAISAGEKTVSAETVRQLLGLSSRETTLDFLQALFEKKPAAVLEIIAKLTDRGLDLKLFTVSALTILRHILLLKLAENRQTLAPLYRENELSRLASLAEKLSSAELLAVITALSLAHERLESWPIASLPLEVAVASLTDENSSKNDKKAATTDKPNRPNNDAGADSGDHSREKPTGDKPGRDKSASKTESAENSPGEKSAAEQTKKPLLAEIIGLWPDLIAEVKKENPALAEILSSSTPYTVSKGRLSLLTENALFADKLRRDRVRLTLENILATMLGEKVSLRIVTRQDISDEVSPSLIANALKMMGGRILETSAET